MGISARFHATSLSCRGASRKLSGIRLTHDTSGKSTERLDLEISQFGDRPLLRRGHRLEISFRQLGHGVRSEYTVPSNVSRYLGAWRSS